MARSSDLALEMEKYYRTSQSRSSIDWRAAGCYAGNKGEQRMWVAKESWNEQELETK
jgi:hypothetical protein